MCHPYRESATALSDKYSIDIYILYLLIKARIR